MVTSERKRVLCVEDNRDICELVAVILTDYEVISASNVAHGWELFNRQTYSLIILDYMLTDGSGLELCERMRAVDFLTPIIFITGVPELTEADIRIAGGQRLLRKASRTFIDDLLGLVSSFAVNK